MKGHDGKNLNKNFYAAIYFMAFFYVITLSGCGGGGGSSSSPTGSVDGYIYLKAASKQKPAGLLLAKEIPAGYVAVPDVMVTLTGTSFTAKTAGEIIRVLLFFDRMCYILK